MGQIILIILALIIAVVVFRALFRALSVIFPIAFALVVLIFFGIPYLSGEIFNKLSNILKIRKYFSIFLSTTLIVFLALIAVSSFSEGLRNINFDLAKYFVPIVLFPIAFSTFMRRQKKEKISLPMEDFGKTAENFYSLYFLSVFTVLYSLFLPELVGFLGISYTETISASWVYWIASCLILMGLFATELTRVKVITEIDLLFNREDKIDSRQEINQLKERFSILGKEEIEETFLGIANVYVEEYVDLDFDVKQAGEELTLQEHIDISKKDIWFFKREWYEKSLGDLVGAINKQVKNTANNLDVYIASSFGFDKDMSAQFRESHLDVADSYNFRDGQFFVGERSIDKIRSCFSCGCTFEDVDFGDVIEGEWYCGDVCRETEKNCSEISSKPMEQFFSEAATSGFLVIAGAQAWSKNQKLFGIGGQGHGFAAEEANTLIDKAKFKDAKVVGGDNVKHGADRLVEGKLIQTKYYGTAARSVGAGFDGQNGPYKYLDEQGRPMQLEVPKEQYSKAVEVMAKKIEDGKVPGVSNPEDAKNLVVKGNVTYSQARNITKFGTIESISYDLADGAIVGLTAGGISFGISTFIFYLKEKDASQAIKVGIIQGGKTFGRSLAIYVTAQQLHRISLVQNTLQHVNVTSPALRQTLSKGFGVTSSQVNNALRGTIVTSVAVIAVTTGPDIVKLARGRVSSAQFVKNLAVTSSSVVGGTVAAIAVGSMLGPVGAFVGGAVGGTVSAAIAKHIGDGIVEDDRAKVLKVIEIQVVYLAKTFMLSEEEMINLNQNLEKVFQPVDLEIIHAGDNWISMTNYYIKPVVVSIVKQRPRLEYSTQDVVEAYEELATV